MKITKTEKMIGKWVKCEKCQEIQYLEDIHNNLSKCPNCNHHLRLSARRRITQIIDEGTFEQFNENMHTTDPLNFPRIFEKDRNTARNDRNK